MAITSVKVTVAGQEYTLNWDAESQSYKTSVTAPSQSSGSNNSGQGPGIGTEAQGKGYYPMVFEVRDDAGNVTTVNELTPTLGEKCKLKVLEKTAPSVSITSPTNGAYIINSSIPINFTASDSGSGIKPDSAMVKIDDGDEQPVTMTGSGVTYNGTYTPDTPFTDGEHTVEVYCYDYDGNKSNVATTTFTVDTIAPTLDITSPADNLITNQTQIVVSGTTNDVTSSPVTVTIKLNSVDQGAVDVSGGSFTKTITGVEGENTIEITATDKAGKTTTITRTVTINTTAPEISEIIVEPNPASAGGGYTISVKIADQ